MIRNLLPVRTDAAALSGAPDLDASNNERADLYRPPPTWIRWATSAFFLLLLMNFSTAAGPRDAQWQKVEDAMRRGLPQTAITNLQPILQGALRDRAYAEAVKALGRRINLEAMIQGGRADEKITRLQAELAKAPKEMTPVLETLLAHWYWQYFQENRWRFLQRTATAQTPGKDFTTWDLPRLFAEIDRHFQAALADDRLLKNTPIASWDDLLEKGTMPDTHRPTLYDFIAREALEFYTSGEQAGARSETAFELSADSPVLDVAEQFLAWNPAGAPPDDAAVKAIRLYQDLLRFHRNDPEPRLAFAAADLERLTWGWNTAFGETKNTRYQAALEAFVRNYADFDISALALERQARLAQQEDDFIRAHQLATKGAELFPDSPGGRLCRNVLTELETKHASLTTERVWNCFDPAGLPTERPPAAGACPEIRVNYRNVSTVYFRAVAYDWEVFLLRRHNRPENLSLEERQEVLAKAPTFAWSENLPPTTDYKPRDISLPAPKQLKPGFYFIISSHDPGFGEKDNMVSMAPVWVSDLALVTRSRQGRVEGFVLDANSGEPLQGAEISIWHLNQFGVRIADPPLKTDADGFFSLKSTQSRGYLIRARHQGRDVATAGDLWAHEAGGDQTPRPAGQTILFTDRMLYRPGQMIQYKGICLWVDQAKDNYEVLKGEEVTVILRDPNGQEVARQKHRANDFGSFSGSLTAPRDRLMGGMYLQVEGRAPGQAVVQVEEYKRPKFQVTLDTPKEAAKLNAKVSLSGHAMGYTGAAVDGAQVRYRVVREVRMPWWWGWYGGPWQPSESQEIAHGNLETGADGSFKVEFIARPDPKIPEKDEPTFVYQITADVTDGAGETRSADRSIRVGYAALETTLAADDWQTDGQPVLLTVSTKTLDDEPQVAEGAVKIYELEPPSSVQRASLLGPQPWPGFRRGGPAKGTQPAEDPSSPNHWPLGRLVAEKGFTTDTNGQVKLSFALPAGAYRALVETQDRFGKAVTGKLPLQVLQPESTRLGLKIPQLLAAPRWELQPGEEFLALWGTGYETGRAYIELEHRQQIVQRFWTRPGQTQQAIHLALTEAHRGGFSLHVTQIRENRAYLASRKVEVPWRNKEFELRWEHFVSKLQPGQRETWTAVVSKSAPGKTNNTEQLVAEMVAALYDESLDAFAPHTWMQRFNVFREDYPTLQRFFNNTAVGFSHVLGGWQGQHYGVDIRYRSFPSDLVGGWRFGFALGGAMRGAVNRGFSEAVAMSAPAAAMPAPAPDSLGRVRSEVAVAGVMALDTAADSAAKAGRAGEERSPAAQSGAKPDLGQVTARKNLQETAFFFPQLTTDSNGTVRMTFTMPEALTKWRFMGFAHDRALRSGYLEDHAVTAKDLMVQPNPPRFLREGDTVEFTVKVSNQSDQEQSGSVRLSLSDAQTGKAVEKLLGVHAASARKPADMPVTEQPFSIPAKQSRTLAWRLTVPDGCGFLTYKAVGATAKVSDGEEGAIPVLSRRILVTESLPLPIRGPATRKFEFDRLLKSGSSKTLQHQSLTVQMVSQPAWYAVLALPYLMEYPYECSEQVFNRLYANALARTIANSDPKIRRIFDQWKNTPALDSPLEKNQELKSVALEETPWLRQAQAESQARRNVGVLFDENRLNYETARTLQKLVEMQLEDGAWPWFPGGRANDYITLYITTGFGRLRHLGVDIDAGPALRSLQRLDAWMTEKHARIQKNPQPEKYVPDPTDALYLYGRSFFLKDQPIDAAHQPAVDFFLAQSRKFWLETGSRQTQAHLALALQRFASAQQRPDSIPAAILASLRQRSVVNEEMGRFWRDTELSWWWYRAPIETQALMIEAFDEVARDAQAVEECRVWLLKQKQTQDWKTTKATADAVYGLLLRGRNLLSSDALVQVKLGGLDVTPTANTRRRTNAPTQQAPEPGTGFYEVRFSPGEIKPRLGEISVRKTDQGVAWGSVHWQYLEDIAKVKPYEGTPLKLSKALFTKTNTPRGPVLEPVKGPVQVGDELVVRVELRVDRDMEYVHLKDQRGSGTEPVNVLSQYRYQDGLAYYESTRDTASHFFIDYLPKGTYVFEYSTRVQLRGQYQTGVASIQCMYAPEFNSHSQSHGLVVR
jgi:uncharacterized protein YfaS (alpha-2-macroglobulin family)